MDTRNIQIFILIILNLFGLHKNIFGLSVGHLVLIPPYLLIIQYCFDKHYSRKFNYKSALISSLSLVLLFKSNLAVVWFLAGFFVIASKFLIRQNGRHLFNPTNFGIVLTLLLFKEHSWVNLSGFGTEGVILAYVLFLGTFVSFKSSRLDVPLIYLSLTFTFLALRMWWLGDPMDIFFHRMESVSLLVFAFLMISDPKTTPDGFWGRFFFCLVVALGAFVMENHFYVREAHFYALFFTSCLLPFFNRYFPGRKFSWNSNDISLSHV